MRLIRGWEKRYCPEATGGLHLSKPALYRAISEEDGLGDRREGEVRTKVDGGHLTVKWESQDKLPPGLRQAIEEHEGSAEETEEFRRLFAEQDDDPELALRRIGPSEWSTSQNLVVSGQGIDSPFLFCLSREPLTHSEWEKLRAALPERYDTWTVTEDVNGLGFEIECGIKRWMGLNEITQHRIERSRGFVTYSYDLAPPSGDPAEVLQMSRWFRKRTKYRDQEEYRLAWKLSSPQWEKMPESINIELTRTGVNLFKPWMPPES